MKSLTAILLLIAYCSFVNAQKQELRKLEDFNKISVKDNIKVNLKKDSVNQLNLKTEILYTYQVKTSVTDGILNVEYHPGLVDKKGKNFALLSYTDINEILGSGPGEINNEGILKTDSLRIDLKSGSNAYLYVDVKYLEVKLREGAMLFVEGYADEQNIKVSTSATYSGLKCEGENVYIDIDTKGKAKVNAEKKLSGTATTWAYVCYNGEPKELSIESKTNSTIVKCGD